MVTAKRIKQTKNMSHSLQNYLEWRFRVNNHTKYLKYCKHRKSSILRKKCQIL